MRALRRNKVEIALVKEIWQITRCMYFVEEIIVFVIMLDLLLSRQIRKQVNT